MGIKHYGTRYYLMTAEYGESDKKRQLNNKLNGILLPYYLLQLIILCHINAWNTPTLKLISEVASCTLKK